jgi:hypothetical protein
VSRAHDRSVLKSPGAVTLGSLRAHILKASAPRRSDRVLPLFARWRRGQKAPIPEQPTARPQGSLLFAQSCAGSAAPAIRGSSTGHGARVSGSGAQLRHIRQRPGAVAVAHLNGQGLGEGGLPVAQLAVEVAAPAIGNDNLYFVGSDGVAKL